MSYHVNTGEQLTKCGGALKPELALSKRELSDRAIARFFLLPGLIAKAP
jgi:hypothetical protein